MKFYRQPLSEEFVYSSPERLTRDSYRWVCNEPAESNQRRQISREVCRGTKKRH
ncbi:MAG: hypothetical protein ABW098_16405 [Candidatus Thiodiazotropha sp.]